MTSLGRPAADNVRAAPPMSVAAPYEWPMQVRCRDCQYAVELVVLADHVGIDTRSRAVAAVDEYLESIGWRPRHGDNDLCPTCRATDEQVQSQVDDLTAPGDPFGGGNPSDAAVVDTLDSMTAQPSAFSELNEGDRGEPGSDEAEVDIAAAEDEWTCPVCGAANDQDEVVCGQCGNERVDNETDVYGLS